MTTIIAELSRAKRASGAPWVRKWSTPIRENLVITWPYTDRPTERPSVRTTGIPLFTLARSSYFGSPLIAHQCCDQWSIDSCQNKVSADQYHLTVSRAQVSTHPGRVFFEVIRWQVTSFQMIAGSFFKIYMKYVVFMSLWPSTINTLISNWPRTRKFSQLFKNASREDRCFSLFSP